MELEEVRRRWIEYNENLIKKFINETGTGRAAEERLKLFSRDYLIDFESELDLDPDNEDGGIITLDTVTYGYIDSFLGRWYIQNVEDPGEENFKAFIKTLSEFYEFLKKNKLYRERAASFTKLMGRLDNKKKYMKRFRDYHKIQQEKDDEEKYLDLMREWEYEDL